MWLCKCSLVRGSPRVFTCRRKLTQSASSTLRDSVNPSEQLVDTKQRNKPDGDSDTYRLLAPHLPPCTTSDMSYTEGNNLVPPFEQGRCTGQALVVDVAT